MRTFYSRRASKRRIFSVKGKRSKIKVSSLTALGLLGIILGINIVTTVAKFFIEFGIPVIDLDNVSREVVKPNSEGLNKIIQVFGKEYLNEKNILKFKLNPPLNPFSEAKLEVKDLKIEYLKKKSIKV